VQHPGGKKSFGICCGFLHKTAIVVLWDGNEAAPKKGKIRQ